MFKLFISGEDFPQLADQTNFTFMIIYVLIGKYLLYPFLIAIIVDACLKTSKMSELNFNFETLETFIWLWKKFDRDGTGFIH
jgi:hypothetical protein